VSISEACGTVIGRYKLLERIGEGGFAVVYMAEQTEPIRRQVALKIIKLGMDTRQVIARFEAERQALAMMDHPGIAKVYDAGATETGRPYFVMQLIRGIPITQYCDDNRLTTAARLHLFLDVCHALQHAHQKGIIHRDIKPTNVLVALHDGRPVPKVIDFGIAKATHQRLTEKTLYTNYRQIIGTPQYMSPEQAEFSDLDIDTRSDIYSLGVLLYELLTSTTPFMLDDLHRMAYDEICHTIRHSEPPTPSRRLSALGDTAAVVAQNRQIDPPGLHKLIRGDLDWIVMKALEKDRTRRYETADALALDVERNLKDEPVLARAPTAAYRFQKAWRRNKLAFVAAGAIVVAIFTGLLFGVRELRELNRLRIEAETEARIYEASHLLDQGDSEAAARLLNEIQPEFVKPQGAHAQLKRVLGARAATHGRWQEASAHFDTLMRVNRLDAPRTIALDHLRAAPVFIKLGELDRYETLRREAIERFGNTDNPIVAEELTRACLLMPASDELLAQFQHMQKGLERAQEDAELDADYLFRPWGCIALAQLQYRRREWKASRYLCEKALSFPALTTRDAIARLLLAMNHRQLEDHGTAHNEFLAASQMIDKAYAGGNFTDMPELGFINQAETVWFDWEYASILHREATQLIDRTASD
jgi:hypothetical protein